MGFESIPPHSDHPLGGLAMNHFAMSERGSTHCPLGFMSSVVVHVSNLNVVVVQQCS